MEQHWPGDEGGVVRRRLVAGALTCLVVVVPTHLAEHWHIFPGMGWGANTPVMACVRLCMVF
jgi:hypothetical protein